MTTRFKRAPLRQPRSDCLFTTIENVNVPINKDYILQLNNAEQATLFRDIIVARVAYLEALKNTKIFTNEHNIDICLLKPLIKVYNKVISPLNIRDNNTDPLKSFNEESRTKINENKEFYNRTGKCRNCGTYTKPFDSRYCSCIVCEKYIDTSRDSLYM